MEKKKTIEESQRRTLGFNVKNISCLSIEAMAEECHPLIPLKVKYHCLEGSAFALHRCGSKEPKNRTKDKAAKSSCTVEVK
jgi:hypothetical protein